MYVQCLLSLFWLYIRLWMYWTFPEVPEVQYNPKLTVIYIVFLHTYRCDWLVPSLQHECMKNQTKSLLMILAMQVWVQLTQQSWYSAQRGLTAQSWLTKTLPHNNRVNWIHSLTLNVLSLYLRIICWTRWLILRIFILCLALSRGWRLVISGMWKTLNLCVEQS